MSRTLHLLILEHILGMPPEQQVSGDTIRYSQDEELVLQALENEDYQAGVYLKCHQGGRDPVDRRRRRKDAAEVDLFLSQAKRRA